MCNTVFTSLNEICSNKCKCGKLHTPLVKMVISGKNALSKLPDVLKKEYSPDKVFVLADKNTYKAAGEKMCRLLDENDIGHSVFVFEEDNVEPDEKSIGSAVMHFDRSCGVIIAVGSGVINDIGKILASTSNKPYVVVATAPSMDGYASASSSVTRSGLKISLSTTNADIIVGDTDILSNAPDIMLKAGLGDMLAKYISICEWRIAHIITGEYYREKAAELVRSALKCCTDNSAGLLKRDAAAVEAVFDGLVICGEAMNMAGVSRPASGAEHYISHVWDMRGASFGTYCNLHGIQCAVGTYVIAKIYNYLKNAAPDKKKALAYAENFNYDERKSELEEFVGKSAKTMIELEARERKYDKDKHKARLEKITEKWDEILKVIDDEIPDTYTLDKLFEAAGLPKTPAEAGIDNSLLPMTFKLSGDIRDKYVLPRLVWDLGIMDEITEMLQ